MVNQIEDSIPGVGLADVLKSLSADLTAARDFAAENGSYGLAVSEAVIELSVTIEKSRAAEASAGVKWNVLSIGGKRSKQDADKRVHEITLKLVPASGVVPSPPTPEEGTEEPGSGPGGEPGPSSGGSPRNGEEEEEEVTAPPYARKAPPGAGRVPTARTIVASAHEVARLLTNMGLPPDRIDELVDEINEEARQNLPARGRSTAKKAPAAKKTPARKTTAKKSTPTAKKRTA
ncbi:trypco2 family protein [Streptomyces sp. NPDC002159]